MSIAACTSCPTLATRSLRERARERPPLPQRALGQDQIIFTRNATEAINLVAQSFGGLVIGRG